MATKPIDRLMFAQGSLCFFCKEPLSRADASVEHLVASANGGGSDLENCVACCKTVNTLLGSMSLKEKFQVVLNQRGTFRCPNGNGRASAVVATPAAPPAQIAPSEADAESPTGSDGPVNEKKPKPGIMFTPEQSAQVIENLRQRGAARPGTLKALTAAVTQLLGKQLPEAEIASLIKHIQARGIVSVKGVKVVYDFPAST